MDNRERERIGRYILASEVEILTFESVSKLIYDYNEYNDIFDDELYYIKKYIKDHKLGEKKRTRDRVWQRFYIFTYIRKTFKTMSLEAIGDLVGVGHACVIHGLKKHDDLTSVNDEWYEAITKNLKETFPI